MKLPEGKLFDICCLSPLLPLFRRPLLSLDPPPLDRRGCCKDGSFPVGKGVPFGGARPPVDLRPDLSLPPLTLLPERSGRGVELERLEPSPPPLRPLLDFVPPLDLERPGFAPRPGRGADLDCRRDFRPPPPPPPLPVVEAMEARASNSAVSTLVELRPPPPPLERAEAVLTLPPPPPAGLETVMPLTPCFAALANRSA